MTDEFAITKIFDGLFKGISQSTHVPAEDYSSIFGGQLYGEILNIIFDLTMPPAISGVSDGLVGAGTMLYSTLAEGVDSRLRKEMFSMGTNLILEVLDPRTWEARKASGLEVKAKIENGDLLGALFRPREEIENLFGLNKESTPHTAPQRVSEDVASNVVEVPVQSEPAVEENYGEETKWRKLSA